MRDSFTEEDWKLFKSQIPAWQENYMEKLLIEYAELINENTKSSEKFWNLEKRIKMDKNHPGVKIEMKRSALISNLVIMIQDGVIDFSDLNDFSEKLTKTVLSLLKI